MMLYQVSGTVTLERHETDDFSSPLIRVTRNVPTFIVEAYDKTEAERIARSIVLTIGEPRGVNYYAVMTAHRIDKPTPKHL